MFSWNQRKTLNVKKKLSWPPPHRSLYNLSPKNEIIGKVLRNQLSNSKQPGQFQTKLAIDIIFRTPSILCLLRQFCCCVSYVFFISFFNHTFMIIQSHDYTMLLVCYAHNVCIIPDYPKVWNYPNTSQAK